MYCLLSPLMHTEYQVLYLCSPGNCEALQHGQMTCASCSCCHLLSDDAVTFASSKVTGTLPLWIGSGPALQSHVYRQSTCTKKLLNKLLRSIEKGFNAICAFDYFILSVILVSLLATMKCLRNPKSTNHTLLHNFGNFKCLLACRTCCFSVEATNWKQNETK